MVLAHLMLRKPSRSRFSIARACSLRRCSRNASRTNAERLRFVRRQPDRWRAEAAYRERWRTTVDRPSVVRVKRTAEGFTATFRYAFILPERST